MCPCLFHPNPVHDPPGSQSSQLCKALTFQDAKASIYSLPNARPVLQALPSRGVGWDSSLAWKTHERAQHSLSVSLSSAGLFLQAPNICCSSSGSCEV